MHKNKPLVSICLCTYKRSSVLRTLAGIANQAGTDLFDIEVVLIDSDINGSAKNTVELFIKETPELVVNYYLASKTGLVIARNLSVHHATGDWLAFIDDDEVPKVDWLYSLFVTAMTYQANCVFGVVKQIYPDSAPSWIIDSDIFSYGRAPKKTGTDVFVGATNNALVRRDILTNIDVVFDERFNLTGGEDTELFLRLSKFNKMVFCEEAVVYESLDEHRLNRDFLIKRAIRSGETYFNIYEKNKAYTHQMLLTVFITLKITTAFFLSILLKPFGLNHSIKFEIKTAANIGKLRAFLNLNSTKIYES